MSVAEADYTTSILAVDDETDILPLLEFCLKAPETSVTTTHDARHALELLKNDRFDLIISDVMMPEMDGLQFLEEVRKNHPDMPVILMSGYAQLELALSAMKQGAFDLVQKPFDFELLRKSVRKAAEMAYLRKLEHRYRDELERTVQMRTEELQQAVQELEKARDEIQKASEERDEFVATISHEMRTPMNGIVGPLELLSETNLGTEQRNYLGIARTSAERMVALVNQMITLASQAFSEIDPKTGQRRPLHTTTLEPTPPERV